MSWVALGEPMGHKKLSWIRQALESCKIQTRINGQDLGEHLTLEVQESQKLDAEQVATPVLVLQDPDPLFETTPSIWWTTHRSKRLAVLCMALRTLSQGYMIHLAKCSSCIPPGQPESQCPKANGVIESCPAGIWSVCRQLIRLKEHLECAAASVLDNQKVFLVDEVAQEGKDLSSEILEAMVYYAQMQKVNMDQVLLTFFQILGVRMSKGRFGRLPGLSKRKASVIVRDVMNDSVVKNGNLLPRVAEIVGEDVVTRDAENWPNN